MTQRQATETVKKKYPGCDVNTDLEMWVFNNGAKDTTYNVYIVQGSQNISYGGQGSSWEEAIKKLAKNKRGK